MTKPTVDVLAARWARIGGGLTVVAAAAPVDLESLLVETARAAHAESRLFWIMGSWIAVHARLIDTRRLGRQIDQCADALASATLGAAIDVAQHLGPSADSLQAARGHCRPLRRAQPLFDIMRTRPVLMEIVRRAARPEFRTWGLWQHEISDKTDAIRPVSWLLARCPELRMRGLLGANLEAAIVTAILHTPATISDLATQLGATRAAVHEAVTNLLGRGLVRKPTQGYRRTVGVPEPVERWISAFPRLV